jgi:hypothetical protein
MASYPQEFETEAAQALAALPDTNPLVIMITDYGRMRAADRACQQGTTK